MISFYGAFITFEGVSYMLICKYQSLFCNIYNLIFVATVNMIENIYYT